VVVFCKPGTKEGKQSQGTEGVITSATIGGQSSEVGNFVVVIVVVCQEIFTFLSLLRKLRFWIPSRVDCTVVVANVCEDFEGGGGEKEEDDGFVYWK
jgi:hypothetical protein